MRTVTESQPITIDELRALARRSVDDSDTRDAAEGLEFDSMGREKNGAEGQD